MAKNVAMLAALAERDMSYRELAHQSKVSVFTVNRVVNGGRCHHRTAAKLAKALGRTPEGLGFLLPKKSPVENI